jgi:DNA-binding transcriptional MerR regulator
MAKKRTLEQIHHQQPLSKRKTQGPLTDKEKLKIIQMRDMGFTLKEITEDIGCNFNTTRHVLKTWAPGNTELVRHARADLLEEFAGKLLGKASQALDYITPESMTHDRVEVRDDEGNLVEVKHSGPTGFQNSNIVGHLTERALKLRESAAALRGEKVEEGPKNIADVGALLDSIGKRAKSLNIDIQLEELREEVEAEYTVVDEDESGEVAEDE